MAYIEVHVSASEFCTEELLAELRERGVSLNKVSRSEAMDILLEASDYFLKRGNFNISNRFDDIRNDL